MLQILRAYGAAMTTTKPELCPDCQRPKAKDARAQTEGCKQGLLGPDGEPHRSKCHELTVAHLRRELSSVRALSAHNEEAARLCRFTFLHAVEGSPCSDAEAEKYGDDFKSWAEADKRLERDFFREYRPVKYIPAPEAERRGKEE